MAKSKRGKKVVIHSGANQGKTIVIPAKTAKDEALLLRLLANDARTKPRVAKYNVMSLVGTVRSGQFESDRVLLSATDVLVSVGLREMRNWNDAAGLPGCVFNVSLNNAGDSKVLIATDGKNQPVVLLIEKAE